MNRTHYTLLYAVRASIYKELRREVHFMDEPMNGLDPIGIAEVRAFLRSLCSDREKTILIFSHILSEMELLADDIGIIDHGVLLEEERLAVLEQRSGGYVHFAVSDTAQAAKVLECEFDEKGFSVQDDRNLRLYRTDLSVSLIVSAFLRNGLEVLEVHTCEDSLEEHFKRITGGEGIA